MALHLTSAVAVVEGRVRERAREPAIVSWQPDLEDLQIITDIFAEEYLYRFRNLAADILEAKACDHQPSTAVVTQQCCCSCTPQQRDSLLVVAGQLNMSSADLSNLRASLLRPPSLQYLRGAAVRAVKQMGVLYRNHLRAGEDEVTRLYKIISLCAAGEL
jgi:hypothetical protein